MRLAPQTKKSLLLPEDVRKPHGQADAAVQEPTSPNVPEPPVPEDIEPDMFISPDDPTIDQSTVLGLNVVLETFSGTIVSGGEEE